MHVSTCVCMYMYMCVWVCMYVCMHECMHVYSQRRAKHMHASPHTYITYTEIFGEEPARIIHREMGYVRLGHTNSAYTDRQTDGIPSSMSEVDGHNRYGNVGDDGYSNNNDNTRYSNAVGSRGMREDGTYVHTDEGLTYDDALEVSDSDEEEGVHQAGSDDRV
jgi:hypothetical protein